MIDTDKNYLFKLPELSMLSCVGERSAEFLQGQLTCNVLEVNDSHMRQGALCNLKGRVLALLDVLFWQGYHLILPRALADDTLNSLSKTAMVSRVRLQKNPAFQFFGFMLNNEQDLLPPGLESTIPVLGAVANEQTFTYKIAPAYYLIVTRAENANTLSQAFSVKEQLKDYESWHRLQLENESVQIYPHTRGLFLPHRLNLHKNNFISFDKGCYKGQEIIARMHYRGKEKYGLKNCYMHSTENLVAGSKIFNPDNQHEIGELIDFASLGNEAYLITISVLLGHGERIQIEGHASSVSLIAE